MEYQYRKMFGGLTHDQYLEEPVHVVQWSLALAGVEDEVLKENMKKAQNNV